MVPVMQDEIEQLRRELPLLSADQTPTVVRLVLRAIEQGVRPAATPEASAYLTPRQLAELLHVSERTVRKWCEESRIRAHQPAGPRGAWRIPADQFRVRPELIARFVERTRAIVASAGGSIDDYER